MRGCFDRKRRNGNNTEGAAREVPKTQHVQRSSMYTRMQDSLIKGSSPALKDKTEPPVGGGPV
jgi:hypothetical protein